MQNISLKNQIIDWLKGKNYWLQFAANIFLDGGKLDKNLLNTIYQFFKEDLGLVPTKSERKKIEFSISSDTSVRDNNELKLKTIKDISNVNALATEQSIPIHYNLTIIYGGNGTGKSGYIRLLNNAFNSRGDKHILPNVFEKNINGFPSCKFTFQTSERLYDLEYPKEKAKLEFTQFSVYDTHSAKVVLEKDNKLNFTPRGFEFFDNILFLYDTLKSLLSNEI
ncbi:MAG: hypothetical protein NTU73_08065, partial [Ignavibacteriae bacterium]|nr:hypothetical protein [Ignavibacteriota bacterium]